MFLSQSLQKGENATLGSIKPEAAKAFELFKKISIENCDVLIDFIRYENLLEWLKDNMKSMLAPYTVTCVNERPLVFGFDIFDVNHID